MATDTIKKARGVDIAKQPEPEPEIMRAGVRYFGVTCPYRPDHGKGPDQEYEPGVAYACKHLEERYNEGKGPGFIYEYGMPEGFAPPEPEPDPEPEGLPEIADAIKHKATDLVKLIVSADDGDWLLALQEADAALESPRKTVQAAIEARLEELTGEAKD